MTTRRDAESNERSGATASLRSSRPPLGRGDPRLLVWAERWPDAVVHLVAAILVATVGLLDHLTGTELSFSIFYLVPISLAAWRLGVRGAALWAALCAVVWLFLDLQDDAYSSMAVAYWNAGVRLGIFLIVAAGLARIRRMWDFQRILAGTDHLTGVLNGRAFHELIELERSRALRYNRPFTLAYLDVDGFKSVNDTLGHARGDEALRLIATTIRENIRSMDTVARLGGDEFGILLPETGPGAAEVAIRKIQARLGEAATADGLSLGFSVGAVVCVGPPDSVDQLLRKADALMYRMKGAGRNGVSTEVLDENYGIEAILRRS